MIKIVSVLVIALLLILIFTGCSKTVTVTPPTVTFTKPAVTVTQPPTTVTQPAVTVTSPPTTVTQPPVTATVTVTPTWIPSPYRGTMTITWQGKTTSGYPISGTSDMTIDENGDISGTFSSSLSGNVTGQVDLVGNMIAVGILQGGTTPIGTTWTAKIILSGKTLSAQGDWKGGDETGTFTGTGTVSY